jgi:hypothetical protein
MNIRRNFFIRCVATLAGDFAVGFAFGSACAWVIQSAALGLFLAFLAWLLAVIAALMLSQHVVHPVVQFALSDHKFDHAVAFSTDAVARLRGWAQQYGADLRAGMPTRPA